MIPTPSLDPSATPHAPSLPPHPPFIKRSSLPGDSPPPGPLSQPRRSLTDVLFSEAGDLTACASASISVYRGQADGLYGPGRLCTLARVGNDLQQGWERGEGGRGQRGKITSWSGGHHLCLPMLREQLSIPRPVRVRGHPGRKCARRKQVSLISRLVGFVPATAKGAGSQGSCTQLKERLFCVFFFPTKSPD